MSGQKNETTINLWLIIGWIVVSAVVTKLAGFW
jgi:hypothetical protein